MSVDPQTDAPAKLKEYSERLKAKPGWFFLTGEKGNVHAALHKLGLYTENKESHTSILIIGNEPTGLWKKAFGLASSPGDYQDCRERSEESRLTPFTRRTIPARNVCGQDY